MTASAILMGLLAVCLTFIPMELANYLKFETQNEVVFQMLGAAFLGLGMLNWMSKNQTLGGIYGRPVVMANFTNYAVTAITLLKLVQKGQQQFWIPFVLFACFAILYGRVLFTQPKAD